MKEADVQKWVQTKLKEAFAGDIYIFKVPQGQYTSRRGIPDLVAGIKGKFVGIEVKTDVGRLTKLQQLELDRIEAAGSASFVIHGKDESIMKIIIRRINEL